jgi:hypothetical protein
MMDGNIKGLPRYIRVVDYSIKDIRDHYIFRAPQNAKHYISADMFTIELNTIINRTDIDYKFIGYRTSDIEDVVKRHNLMDNINSIISLLIINKINKEDKLRGYPFIPKLLMKMLIEVTYDL